MPNDYPDTFVRSIYDGYKTTEDPRPSPGKDAEHNPSKACVLPVPPVGTCQVTSGTSVIREPPPSNPNPTCSSHHSHGSSVTTFYRTPTVGTTCIVLRLSRSLPFPSRIEMDAASDADFGLCLGLYLRTHTLTLYHALH